MAGRPPTFETPEDLQAAADEYFEKCNPEVMTVTDNDGNTIVATNSQGKPIIKENKPTITGLAYHLGFESRQSFYDYEKRDTFSYTIKRLRLRIECSYESSLREKGDAGSIFGLKNFNWSDKQEIEHSGTVNIIDDIK